MSVKRGETKYDTLYIGLQKRVNPTPNETSEMVYAITKDHKEVYGKPFVTLLVGTTYRFVIETPGHPFYITTDELGGGAIRDPPLSYVGSIEVVPENTDEKGNVGITKGVLTWSPAAEHTQMKLFYQSNFHQGAGNQIIVKYP